MTVTNRIEDTLGSDYNVTLPPDDVVIPTNGDCQCDLELGASITDNVCSLSTNNCDEGYVPDCRYSESLNQCTCFCINTSLPIPPTAEYGCTYPSACNYNSRARIEDGSCWFPEEPCICEDYPRGPDSAYVDCYGVCNGANVLDDCGVCSCSGIAPTSCGSNLHPYNGDMDCSGVCFGSDYSCYCDEHYQQCEFYSDFINGGVKNYIAFTLPEKEDLVCSNTFGVEPTWDEWCNEEPGREGEVCATIGICSQYEPHRTLISSVYDINPDEGISPSPELFSEGDQIFSAQYEYDESLYLGYCTWNSSQSRFQCPIGQEDLMYLESGRGYFLKTAEDMLLKWNEEIVTPIYGCTDPSSCNYNMNAQLNDGSCEPPLLICEWDEDEDCCISGTINNQYCGSYSGGDDACVDDDDEFAAQFGGCANAVVAIGCDFIWDPNGIATPVSELCPETCGECFGDEISIIDCNEWYCPGIECEE